MLGKAKQFLDRLMEKVYSRETSRLRHTMLLACVQQKEYTQMGEKALVSKALSTCVLAQPRLLLPHDDPCQSHHTTAATALTHLSNKDNLIRVVWVIALWERSQC